MKNVKVQKENNVKVQKVISIVTCILLLVVAVLGLVITQAKRTHNFTKQYEFYCSVKEVTSLDDVRSILKQNGLEYQITDNRVSIEKYADIQFDVLDNETVQIASNKTMENFDIIEAEDISKVEIYGIKDGSKVSEKLVLQDGAKDFIKEYNQYLVVDSFSIPSLLVNGALIITAIVGLVIIFKKK